MGRGWGFVKDPLPSGISLLGKSTPFPPPPRAEGQLLALLSLPVHCPGGAGAGCGKSHPPRGGGGAGPVRISDSSENSKLPNPTPPATNST